MSLVIVFEYEIDPAGAEAFEAVYGRDGEWARYFAGAEGYRGTELLRAAGGHYLVIDRWNSEAGYDAFLTAHADEYGPATRTRLGSGCGSGSSGDSRRPTCC